MTSSVRPQQMRPKYSLLPLCVALGLGAGAALPMNAARAQLVRPTGTYVPGSMGIPPPEPKITLTVVKRSLGTILKAVFLQTRYEYQVETEKLGATAFSLDVKQMPITRVLDLLLAQDTNKDEPLVYYFTRNPAGGGTFTITREFIQIGQFDGENRVSLSYARITDVFPQLFRLMKVQGRVEPDVPPICISVQLRPMDWSQSLPQVIREANLQEPGLTYSLDGDTYVVHLHKLPSGLLSTGAAMPGVRKVKLVLSDVKLRDALAQLFAGSSFKYQVADRVPDTSITYSTSAEPEIAALQSILREAEQDGPQVTYREGKGVLYIELGPLAGEATTEPIAGLPKLITLDLKKTRIKSIIMSIESQGGIPIKVAPTVPDLPIDFKVTKQREEAAIKALLAAAKDSLPTLNYKTTTTGFMVLNGE